MSGHPKAKAEVCLVADWMFFVDVCGRLFTFIW